MAEGRRLRRWAVMPQHFIDAAKGIGVMPACEVSANPLPQDARYIGCTFDPLSMCVWIFLESPSFDPVEDNQIVPEHGPTAWRRL